jgi:hypothetical protein
MIGGDVTRASAMIIRCVVPGIRWKFSAVLSMARESYPEDEKTVHKLWREAWRKISPEHRSLILDTEREHRRAANLQKKVVKVSEVKK